MRIASFNVENLFERARALNLDSWEEGRPILDRHAELNAIFAHAVYSSADKARILELLGELGLAKSDESRFVRLRRNRGKLLVRRRDGTVEVVASGREDWIGWLELRNEPVNETAIRNTARVITDVDADILAVIEAEHRVALKEFSDDVLPMVEGEPYEQVMLIDGNDTRGIDVGLMTKRGHTIGTMRSHVHDQGDGGSTVFSRDCPEFQVITPAGERLWVLVNHLKSKGFGDFAASTRRRRAQAARVAEIYRGLRDAGEEMIAVVGDMNDTPDSAALAPLVVDTDLAEAATHPCFDDGGRPGTYGPGTAPNKIDLILLSPALFARMTGGGVFRKGAWPGVRPRKWEVYDTLTSEIHVASDHHAIWADIGP